MADYHIHDIGYEYTAKGRWDELACQVPPSSSFLLPPAYCQKSRKRFHQSSAPHTISFASKFHISMPLLRHVPTPKSNRIRTETRASDRLKSDTGSYIVERKKKRARNRSIGWILADAFKCEKSNHQIVNPPLPVSAVRFFSLEQLFSKMELEEQEESGLYRSTSTSFTPQRRDQEELT